MAQQLGDAVPPVLRRVGATTIWFCEEAAPAGDFAVSVACSATRSFEFWRLGAQEAEEVIEQKYTPRSTMTTFAVDDLASLQSAAACRGTLRGMLSSLPEPQSMFLTEEEWDAVVPGDIVTQIVRAAGHSNGCTFSFAMEVHRVVVQDEGALLLACKEKLASTEPGKKKKCPICLAGLYKESAVELLGCRHAFHRRCISTWFSTEATTCPICRDDVWFSALPECREQSSTGEPAQGTTSVPDID